MSLMEEEHGSGSIPPPANAAAGDGGEGSSTAVAVQTCMQKTTRHRHELVPELRFPPGYHFLPTEEELVDVYLRAKIEGRAPPLDIIKEVDILKFEPHVLVGKYRPYGENRWFFFTRREKSASNKQNEPRRQLYCADGVRASWKATGRVLKIFGSSGTEEEGRLIGSRRILIYHSNAAGEDNKWSMYEYVMTDYLGMDQWVLCTLQMKQSTNDKSAKKHERGEEHNSSMKPKTTKRKKKTTTSQAQENTTCTPDDRSVCRSALLMHKQDQHHQAIHEQGDLILRNSNNTSLIVDHPIVAEDHHETPSGDYHQLEDPLSMHQQVTYNVPNNLTTLLMTQHHHHLTAYHLTPHEDKQYQHQNINDNQLSATMTSYQLQDYQYWQLELQQKEKAALCTDQRFFGDIIAGTSRETIMTFSRQKNHETSPDNVFCHPLVNSYGSVVDPSDEQQAAVPAGDPPQMMSNQAASSVCEHGLQWCGGTKCFPCAI